MEILPDASAHQVVQKVNISTWNYFADLNMRIMLQKLTSISIGVKNMNITIIDSKNMFVCRRDNAECQY